MTDLEARNRQMAEAFLAGTTYRELIAQYGLSESQIVRIFRARGVRLTDEERKRRNALARKTPEYRAKCAKNRRELRIGNKPLFHDQPEKRKEYVFLRNKVGPAEAKRMMGAGA